MWPTSACDYAYRALRAHGSRSRKDLFTNNHNNNNNNKKIKPLLYLEISSHVPCFVFTKQWRTLMLTISTPMSRPTTLTHENVCPGQNSLHQTVLLYHCCFIVVILMVLSLKVHIAWQFQPEILILNAQFVIFKLQKVKCTPKKDQWWGFNV